MKNRTKQRLASVILAASLLTGGSFPVVAAGSVQQGDTSGYDASLVYGGDHKIVATPETMNLFHEGMMPGEESARRLWLRNDYSTSIHVYVRAESVGEEGLTDPVSLDFQKELLQKMQMQISVKLGNGSQLIRYQGNAAGVFVENGSLTDTSQSQFGLLLGRLSPQGAADMTVTIKASQDLGNEYQNAAAKVKWIFTCDADRSGTSNPSGGGGKRPGGGGGRIITSVTSVVPVEDIEDSEVPLNPGSSEPEEEVIVEDIAEDDVPLIDAPGTGPKTGDESHPAFWITLFVLSGLCILVVISMSRRKQHK
ncbi:hypothetical protein [Clostridium minihomine]|uniref:hypothetical protein n=1 Tax=Clostridium minihomine TaxID=2045012 RepID=UPI000C757FF2|nr:hypothetical protein [Clostridium minihomine]